MKSVLSIQSHVVHGYVGGRAAIFPLQTQGWEVDNINTVHFSNHTGYGHFKGQKLDRQELRSILDQLVNQLQIEYGAVVTGYAPNAELISCIREYIVAMKEKSRSKVIQKSGSESGNGQSELRDAGSTSTTPSLIYLMDPVMGDNNYMYVDQSCVDEYRKLIHSDVVDIITPNQFELELLMDYEITNRESIKNAIEYLHNQCHIPYVVITSVESKVMNMKRDSDDNDDGDIKEEDCIYCVISTKPHPTSNAQMRMFQIPTIRSYFTGVGDLFSALLLDKFVANNAGAGSGNVDGHDDLRRLSRSVNQVLTIMAKTLKLTHKLGMQQAATSAVPDINNNKSLDSNGNHEATVDTSEIPNGKQDEIVGKINDGETMKYFELKVIQAKEFYSYDGEGEFKEMKL
ncbi:BUD16 [Candida theae]|uniref:pyridoxal kinase n=1 Tax=Candida theae TaxID=1198502 RepID=A0AAD5FYP0_9ASCO|nr:BUD16 [Candida theae]KAI5958289.1 BUD16 [Candida theae]